VPEVRLGEAPAPPYADDVLPLWVEGVIFGKDTDHFDHCLTCGRKVREFEFTSNNGVCDDCPRLTVIAPEFWKVINHLANQGDWNAQETFRKYG
jgi:hypothetical protein